MAGMSANATAYKALTPEERLKRIQGVTGSVPTATPSTPVGAGAGAGVGYKLPSNSVMMGSAPSPTVQPNTGVTAPSQQGYTPPAYGSNVQGFDPNNAQNVQLADAGQKWATAKAAGDTAGMSAAAALGQQIRSGVQGSSYDSVKGISTLPTAQPATPVVQGSVPPQDPYGQLDKNQINTEAGYRMDKERSDLQTATDKQTANVRNNAGYANQLINDSRVLQDFNKSNSVNPFTQGKQTWDQGLIGRQRSIDDSSRGTALTNELNAVQSDLYNFDKLAPDKKQTLINEMTRIERQYGLEVGSLMGTFNGQRTLAGQGQDFNQQQQGWENRFNYGQATGTFGNGQQTMQNQEFQYTQGRDKVADERWQSEFERIKKQDGIANAINWAQNSISQQNANTSASSSANSNANQIADRAQREAEFNYTKEQDLLSNRTKPPEELTDKASTDNYNVIMDDLSSGATKEEGRSLLQQNSANLTDADYKKINDWINGNL